MEKIHGVNLGNWLVLEKWMNTALFAGTDAEDEYYLPRRLSGKEYEARIRTHRSEYITERDFLTIKSWGLNAVRIPVPYFIFGDRAPFIGCIDELDKAFNWAEQYGIKILIDLHTAPLSQNGFDNGGISGVCKWSQSPEEVPFVLSVLKRLSERYGSRPGLWGIEILNEPILKDMWDMMRVQTRYPPVDKELAAGSGGTTVGFMKNFYLDAYGQINPNLAAGKQVVFHDCFELFAWKDFMRGENYRNVVLDTHQYLMAAEMQGCPQTLDGYRSFITEKFENGIREMQHYFPVICGEWSLFNSLACGRDTNGGQSVLNGTVSAPGKTVSAEEKKKIYRALAGAQLAAWDTGIGYFYWNYKLLTDTVNTEGWAGWDSWDLGRCVANGWFPTEQC
jgi:aryl-phospho-beta-D-glucosidase BglC (GH1 family)